MNLPRASAVGQPICAAVSRVFDELPVIVLGFIAIELLNNGQIKGDTLVHDGVLMIISGLLGYMKAKGDGASAKVSTPAASASAQDQP